MSYTAMIGDNTNNNISILNYPSDAKLNKEFI